MYIVEFFPKYNNSMSTDCRYDGLSCSCLVRTERTNRQESTASQVDRSPRNTRCDSQSGGAHEVANVEGGEVPANVATIVESRKTSREPVGLG